MAGAGLVAAAATALVAAAAWVSGTPLDAPRTEVAAAVLRGEIVVAGGFVATGGNSRRVDGYTPGRDSWRRLPDLPVAVDHAAAASWRGRLVVVGGYGPDRQPLRSAFLFTGDRWQVLPRPPDARAAAAAAATSAGKVYVVGGGRRRVSRGTCSCSTCAPCAGHGLPDRRPASISRPGRSVASSTPSAVGRRDTTRTWPPWKPTIRAHDAGGACHRFRPREAGPLRPGWRAGSSRSAVRSRPAPSQPCSHTTCTRAAGRRYPTCRRRGTVSASSPSAVACGRSRAAPSPG